MRDEERGADQCLASVLGRLGEDIARDALEEASRRAQAVMVQRLTDSLITAAERSLADPADQHPMRSRSPKASACYVFAIARAGGDPPEPLPGIDGAEPVCRLVEGPLAAFVCDVDHRMFDGLADEAVEPDGRLAVLARRHDETVRRLFQCQAILPLRFGTMLTSRRAVAVMLASGRERFVECIERIDGRAEWTCRVRAAEVAAPMEPADPHTATAGARYLALRESELRMDEEASNRLRGAAQHLEAVALPLVEESVRLTSTRDELRMAFLVKNERAGALGDALVGTRAEPGDGVVEMHVSGPLPPYHFVDVQLEADASLSAPSS